VSLLFAIGLILFLAKAPPAAPVAVNKSRPRLSPVEFPAEPAKSSAGTTTGKTPKPTKTDLVDGTKPFAPGDQVTPPAETPTDPYIVPPGTGTPIDDVRLDDPWDGKPIYIRDPAGGDGIIVIDDPGSYWYWLFRMEKTEMWAWLIRYRPDLLWHLMHPAP
jgi:hypothetical protein